MQPLIYSRNLTHQSKLIECKLRLNPYVSLNILAARKAIVGFLITSIDRIDRPPTIQATATTVTPTVLAKTSAIGEAENGGDRPTQESAFSTLHSSATT
jgi:hypothetical protein